MNRLSRTLAIVLAIMVLSGCSSSSSDEDSSTITVFAASSLTHAFGEIGADFEAANPGTRIAFSFGASDVLAQQIADGAPADVFASASPRWMDAVASDPGVAGRVDFARNQLVIVTPSENSADIRHVDDLANPGVQLVLGAEGVPVGDYAREMLANANITEQAEANVVSNEPDARAVLAKVSSGEADAGVVYLTDVEGAARPDDVHAVPIPDDLNVIAIYPIACVTGAGNSELARRFVDYVAGDGQDVLRSYDFLPPTG